MVTTASMNCLFLIFITDHLRRTAAQALEITLNSFTPDIGVAPHERLLSSDIDRHRGDLAFVCLIDLDQTATQL